MIDWEALRRNIPRITEQLTEMMVNEAIPTLIKWSDGELEAMPAVAIQFVMRDGSGQFEVRLSVDKVEPDELCANKEPP